MAKLISNNKLLAIINVLFIALVIAQETNYSTKFGFKDCTITGTTSSDYFSNITINCLVDSKTIDQSIYPELFDRTYHKTIYKKPNGDTFYRYLDNSNVWVYTQII